MRGTYVGALDQGTTSTRFVVYDHDGAEVARHQLEHAQVLPRAGWVEHDPVELWERTCSVVTTALGRAGVVAAELAAVGVANQRETTLVWDRRSGRPLAPAIVWQDTRTAPLVAALERAGADELVRQRTGLRAATYFSGPKLQWILDNVDGVRHAAERGDALFGTIDSWLVWNLTGGIHVTDATNASRTMLMDLETLDWDDELLDLLTVPRSMLPAIGPSSDGAGDLFTTADGPFGGAVRIAATLGDQQAAMVGQGCFAPGDAKCTYGTGSFVLMNTGTEIVHSSRGLLSTVCYQIAGERPRYALEGSVAVAGAAVQWLRDQLGIISDASECEGLARQVADCDGLYFVPAFSGLYAPRWRPDARGVIVGMARSHGRAHLARATLEAICYQTRDVVDVMAREVDSAGIGAPLDLLRVDGGVAMNDLCMQMQADILGIPVVRPAVTETTALGAARAAGMAVGFFDTASEPRSPDRAGRRWDPESSKDEREKGYRRWTAAVERTLGWADADADADADAGGLA